MGNVFTFFGFAKPKKDFLLKEKSFRNTATYQKSGREGLPP